jgi:RNA polymerase sigma factor (sigma-70 family)
LLNCNYSIQGGENKVTNEELALRIQAGEKEQIVVLWKQVERLIAVMARKYARMDKIPAFVDIEDFKQCGYFAMLKAIETYKAESGFKFTTCLNYAMKNAVRDMLGLQSGRGTISRLTVSLNKPVGEEEDTELQDLIPDDSIKIGEDLEREEIERVLQEEIKKLSSEQAYVVVQHWYKNRSYQNIADVLGMSYVDVKRIARRALQKMGRSRRLFAIFLTYYSGMWYTTVECPYIGERLTEQKQAGNEWNIAPVHSQIFF